MAARFWALAPGAALALVLGLSSSVHADNDWLGIEVPQPMDQGFLSVNENITQTERQYWQDGNRSYYMVDTGGTVNIQDLLKLDTRLDWRVSRRLVVEANVPLVYSEFSPYFPGFVQYYNLGTPGVDESQGMGDVRLGLRGAFWDRPTGFNAGWSLSLIAPTGLSPFDAPQTLAATGDGRWQVLPSFVAGGRGGNWEGWLQITGRWQAGQQVQASPNSYLSWQSTTSNLVPVTVNNTALPGGGAWLAPRYGADAVAGLAWLWYQDADSRMGLALEAKAHWLSPWATASGPLGLPAEEYVVLTPELQARYGRYSVVGGWQAQYLWAVEEPFALYGELIFDVAYSF